MTFIAPNAHTLFKLFPILYPDNNDTSRYNYTVLSRARKSYKGVHNF